MKFSVLFITVLCFSIITAASLAKPKHTALVNEYLEVFQQVLPLVTLVGDSFIEFVWLSAHIDQISVPQQQIATQILKELLANLKEASGQQNKVQLVSQAVAQLNAAFSKRYSI